MSVATFNRKSSGGRLRNRALTLLLASLILLLSVLAHAPPVRADSTLVQQSNGGCATTGCSPSAISFPSSVTAGDVVVVTIAVYSGSVTSVGDILGSTFTLVAEGTISPMAVYIYDATLSSSGSDSVFVFFAGAIQGGVYAYEVSGVTTVGGVYEVAGGDCYYPPCSISTSSSSASFQSGAFLVSMVGLPSLVNTTAGTGFTLSPGSSGGTFGGNAEYATSGVSSPTFFPFTLSSPAYPWAEMGLALPPSGSTSSTTSATTSTTTSTSSTAPPPPSGDEVTSLILTATSGQVTGGVGGALYSTLIPTVTGNSFDEENPSATISGAPAGISVSFSPGYDLGPPFYVYFTMAITVTPSASAGIYTITADESLLRAGADCSGICVRPTYQLIVEPTSDIVESVSLTPSAGVVARRN
jgi:hypothetical protein